MKIPFFGGSSLKGVDLMTLVPVRRVRHEVAPENGLVSLLVPRYAGVVTGRVLQPLLSPSKRYIRVTLEARGSLLWENIDGKAAAADLVRIYMEEFPGDTQDSAERVAAYLYSMADNRFIELLNPLSGESQPGGG